MPKLKDMATCVKHVHCGDTYHRRTGRTTRAVMQAILWASGKEDVIFIATHHQHAFDTTIEVLRRLGVEHHVSLTQMRVTIEGGWSIRFYKEDVDPEKIRGHRYLVVDQDE
jgi:threonine dehydrogenase-like Zn-dependent dehydrogenase